MSVTKSIKSKSEIARIGIKGLAISVGSMLVSKTNAQMFAPPVSQPFGLSKPSNEFAYGGVAFADIDMDGDLDCFASGLEYIYGWPEYKSLFYENTGTNNLPAFAPPIEGTFAITPYGIGRISLVDIDGDQDYDILSGYYGALNDFLFFENEGTSVVPSFASPVLNPFGIGVGYLPERQVALADLDDDGDLDLLSTSAYNFRRVAYYENIGNATTVNFDTPVENPFGLHADSTSLIAPTFADVDMDGDSDIFFSKGGGYFDLYSKYRRCRGPFF